jgi:cytoskeletal protein RodZ
LKVKEGQQVMAWLILIVPAVSVAVLIWLRRQAARQVGLPSMTPLKLSSAVSHANKLSQDALSVTLAQSETSRAIGPMAAIGWQVNASTIDRTGPALGKRNTVTFSRVPAGPRYRYEYLYDRDTWVRRTN